MMLTGVFVICIVSKHLLFGLSVFCFFFVEFNYQLLMVCRRQQRFRIVDMTLVSRSMSNILNICLTASNVNFFFIFWCVE